MIREIKEKKQRLMGGKKKDGKERGINHSSAKAKARVKVKPSKSVLYLTARDGNGSKPIGFCHLKPKSMKNI